MFKDENRHYSLRKLSIGLASVLIGISFASSMNGSIVKADTVNGDSNSAQTVAKGSDTAIKIDAKDDANRVESNTESAPEATKKDPNAITQDIKQKAIKASDDITKMQAAAEKTAKGNIPEAAAKNATDGGQAAVKPTAESTLKGANLIAKQQNTTAKGSADADKDDSSKAIEKDSLTAKNNALKATVEAAKQGLETPAVPHSDSNATALNLKDSKAIAENMLKEGEENQVGADPAKSKLKLAALLTTTGKKLNAQMLSASKVTLPAKDTNGGFDEATWGKLNVNNWQGSVQGDYYQLTDYTGDANHVIVPNEADFAKAGISTSGKQVGVTSDLMHSIFRDKTTAQDATVAFSKTDNKVVKAIGTDWRSTWDLQDGNGAKLNKFDGTNLDVSNVTSMSNMFFGNQISDLSSLANWSVNNVTDMSYMFQDNQISDLSPLANWKVDNVTDMTDMFFENQISDLSPLAKWDVSNVTNMDSMFSNNQISDLSPLAKWDVSNVTDMSSMFFGNRISDLSPLANWNVNNVTEMSGMFDDNILLIPINTVKAKRVINFVYPEGYTGKKQNSITQTIDVSQKVRVLLSTKYYSKPSNNILDWGTKTETPLTTSPTYFQDYTVPKIKGLLEPDQTVISEQQADITKPINVTVTYKLVESNTNDAFALDSKNGLHEHANVNDNGGYDEDYWGKLNINDWNYTTNGNTITITGYKGNNTSSLIIPNGADFGFIHGQDANNTRVEISSSVMHDLAKNATRIGLSKTANKKVAASESSWANAFGGLTDESGTNSNVNGGIKYGSPNLTQMDLHNLDTSAITVMAVLFNGGSNLTTVGDLSDWNTSNVTIMRGMFQRASSLTNIGDLSEWQTGNVTDMAGMFFNATNLTNIGDLSKWQTGNVTNMYGMFYNATNLTNIGNLDNWDTSKVTNMSYMFDHVTNLTNIGDLSKWQTGNVTNMANMFSTATNLTNIGNLDNWDTSKVTNMKWMFTNAKNLTNIGDLSKWRTSNVTNMSYMFANAKALRHLNISNWNLTKLANKNAMKYMFAMDTYLTVFANDLTLPTWYQNEINDANYFWNNHMAVITNVPELIKATGDINNLKIDKQNASRSIFYDSKGSSDAIKVLTDANNQYIADYNKANPTKVLKLADTVDTNDPIALANASFVTVTYKLVESNTNDAFALDSKNGLHEHANVNDNGGYDTDFWGKINVDDWNYTVNGDRIEINGLKDGALTGANDAVIVPNLDDFKLAGKDGGAKTVYISKDALGINAKHKYYGLSKTNGNTFATDSDLSLVFYKNSNLTHADLNSLNTSNATDMTYMFSNTKSLTDLDVSNWDTGNVTNMTAMFIGASSLTNLDVSKWNTSNVTNMGRMFTNASRLTNLDVSHWDTSKVTDMHAMFYNASSLTSLDVSHWDTSKVTNMRYMFDGARSLTNLNVSNWDTSKVTNMRDMFNGAGSLALIVNGNKFADYLVKHNFADSEINSSVKSVTTDNTKLLQLLTNDSQHDSATRTIVLMFPSGYSPDLTKYHLTKTGNTYQIKQSIDYNKPYVQGTVLINATGDITKHHIDTTEPNKLSDTWQPNYDKLVLAHKNSDGSVSFDAIQLPKVPGYKARINNPNVMLFSVSFMALPKPVTPVQNDAKPAKTVTPAIPVAIDVAKPIKTEPKVATTPKVINLSNDVIAIAPKETTWQVANNLEHDTYRVSNGQYAVELPHISNAQLHVIANDSTKDSVLFTYKGQNIKYVFNIKFVNGHYLLTTYEIKSDKLIKLIDYNFVKSSKMIDTILDWLKR